MSSHTSAAPEAVWRLLADPTTYPRWVVGTSTVRGADDDWPQVGTRLHHRFGPWLLRTPDHTVVVACEPPHHLVLRANARPWARVSAELTVSAAGGGSRIEFCEHVTGGLVSRLGRATVRVQRWRMRRALERLVELAER